MNTAYPKRVSSYWKEIVASLQHIHFNKSRLDILEFDKTSHAFMLKNILSVAAEKYRSQGYKLPWVIFDIHHCRQALQTDLSSKYIFACICILV